LCLRWKAAAGRVVGAHVLVVAHCDGEIGEEVKSRQLRSPWMKGEVEFRQ
jgi:hypothetical protein